MDPYFSATRPYDKNNNKIIQVVGRSCALCCDENYVIKISKGIKKLYLKILMDNVISKVINMLKDIIY
jgi:hypothetical protein